MAKVFRASAKGALLLASLSTGAARAEAPADLAARFGARPTVMQMSLSPDGTHVAFVAARGARETQVLVRGIDDAAEAKPVMLSSGKGEQFTGCDWVSNKRLACRVMGVDRVETRFLRWSRLVALEADGSGQARLLSAPLGTNSRGLNLSGGGIIDWLPDGNGAVLMARARFADDRLGSHIGSDKGGMGVDRVDTRSLSVTEVEKANPLAYAYLSDGLGTVRVMGLVQLQSAGEQVAPTIAYSFRRKGSRAWEPLSTYNTSKRTGFMPVFIDGKANVAYGFGPKDGRQAIFTRALDGSGAEKLVFARPDVDVGGLAALGRRPRVIGAVYLTDTEQTDYFDPDIAAVAASLHKALPGQPNVRIVDASVDERKLLVFAGSDADPGLYYIFDRDKRDLHILEPVRPQLEGVKLAAMKAVRYPAADGTMIPAYLTLPASGPAKGLPAIVLPHGGPADRDSWGFDWLPQYFAARGYAVLQPQFRGSAGYGEAWFLKNGFQSWRIAVGDVTDGARWLAAQGIADPAKLAAVGWSYGGYAALQAAVLAPDLFKAVVAIAPVTDLATLKQETAYWNDDAVRADFIGSGPHIVEGSPAQNAARIKAPVLLVHGTNDANVALAETTLMEARLRNAGGTVETLVLPGLDHQLSDSDARKQLLERSDALIRAAFDRPTGIAAK